MPKLIVIAGFAGSGKSTLARSLARELPAVLIDKDSATRRLADIALSLAGSSAEALVLGIRDKYVEAGWDTDDIRALICDAFSSNDLAMLEFEVH